MDSPPPVGGSATAPQELLDEPRGFPLDPRPAWSLPPGAAGRAENLAFAPDASFLAVVDTDAERVAIYERRGDALDYGDAPVGWIEGPLAEWRYPHDVDVSSDGRRLVVAHRLGRSVQVFRRIGDTPVRFAREPAWTLKGRASGLGYCDGARLVPPHEDLIATANLAEHRITFLRRSALGRDRWRRRPHATLEGEASGLSHPDGLAFSPSGDAMAVANHAAGTVTVYARSEGDTPYGPRPVATLGDGALACPHSLAFSRDGAHLAVTEAGGRFLTVFHRASGAGGHEWSREPVLRLDATPAHVRPADQEGGPKGVAFGDGFLAYCSPEAGVRLHRLTAAASASRP